MYFRCYDHLIKLDGRSYLLLDAPDGVETDILREDEQFYHTKLCEQLLGPTSIEIVFLDLFPAIKSIYDDDKEGCVIYLEFMSNHMAQVRGQCAKNSKTDWRKHPYHAAGQANAEMNAFKLGVKFVAHPANPIVLLPGQATMVYQTNEAKRPPLNYMVIDEFTTWDGFSHAVGRVLQHVKLRPKAPHDKEAHATT